MRLQPFTARLVSAGTYALVVGGVGAAVALLLGVQDDLRLYWAIVSVPAGLTFVRGFYRVRLEVDAEEIRVFNVRKAYRIRWESVARIDTVSLWLGPR